MNEWINHAHDQDVMAYLRDNLDLVIPWLISTRAGIKFTREFIDFHDEDFRAFLEVHREGATA